MYVCMHGRILTVWLSRRPYRCKRMNITLWCITIVHYPKIRRFLAVRFCVNQMNLWRSSWYFGQSKFGYGYIWYALSLSLYMGKHDTLVEGDCDGSDDKRNQYNVNSHGKMDSFPWWPTWLIIMWKKDVAFSLGNTVMDLPLLDELGAKLSTNWNSVANEWMKNEKCDCFLIDIYLTALGFSTSDWLLGLFFFIWFSGRLCVVCVLYASRRSADPAELSRGMCQCLPFIESNTTLLLTIGCCCCWLYAYVWSQGTCLHRSKETLPDFVYWVSGFWNFCRQLFAKPI